MEKENSCVDYTVQMEVCLFCGRQTISYCLMIQRCKLVPVILFTPADSGGVRIKLLNHETHLLLHQAAA